MTQNVPTLSENAMTKGYWYTLIKNLHLTPKRNATLWEADIYLAIMFKPFALTLFLRSNMVSFSGVTENAAYKTDGS